MKNADFSGADLGIDLGAVMGSSGSINTSGLAGGGHVPSERGGYCGG